MLPSHGASDQDRPTPFAVDTRYAWYVLGLLTLSYALAYVDRQMLNLLVDPIRTSLGISDTQFSFVQGTAFVVAFLIGTPIFGRIVDIINRRFVLIAGVILWSSCTIACGYATNFETLFAARFGVGLSEACVYPVTWSLIGDYFSSRHAPRAMSIFHAGALLGSGFSLIAGGAVIGVASSLKAGLGMLGSLETWQMAFVVIGLPGFLLAIVLLTLRDPRPSWRMVRHDPGSYFSTRDVLRFVCRRRGFYARMYIAIGMVGVVQLSVPAWYPTFLIRTHGMPASEVGYLLGAIAVVCGASGTLIGPAIAQWLQNLGLIRHPLVFAAGATLSMLAFSALIPIPKTGMGAVIVGACIYFSVACPTAIISVTTQQATPNRARGTVGALFTFSAQILGFGIGPTAVALVTDKVFHDPKMVGHSLQLIACTASVICGIMLFTALRQPLPLIGGKVEDEDEERPKY